MARAGNQRGRDAMADAAGGRAGLYGTMVRFTDPLPDQGFLEDIQGRNFQHFLDSCCSLENRRFRKGTGYVSSYTSGIENRPAEDVLKELAVDRTRLLRGSGQVGLKPPYEGLYGSREGSAPSVLEVKRFYRSAGIVPHESVREAPDFICVELDFMKQLCLREERIWREDGDGGEILLLESSFLERHLGTWVGEFCGLAEQQALTDFFKGLFLILDAFIARDRIYVQDLIGRR